MHPETVFRLRGAFLPGEIFRYFRIRRSMGRISRRIPGKEAPQMPHPPPPPPEDGGTCS